MSGVLHGVLASLKAAAAAATDSFFKYVTLLLHGDGTNGAQNNTFLDGSTNNFTITRNGNTTQGTFSPFSQTGWSNYFDGTGDYLSVPRNNAFLPVANEDFTFEAWVYLTATPGATGSTIMAMGEWGASSDWFFWIDSSRQASLYQASTITSFTNTTTLVPLNAWTHIAAARSGTGTNNLTVYVNGSGQSGTTNATMVGAGLYNLSVGADQNGDESNFTGYISNLRIVKGTAVYTANFTPPTAPLTAITNTSLLTCQSNRFIDNSSNAFAITRNGDVRVEAFSPFNPSTTYSTSVVGGSGYFDGTGDYLTVPDNAAFDFGSGDWTVESWFYRTGTAAATASVIYNQSVGGAASDSAIFLGAGSDGIALYLSTSGNSWTNFITSSTAPALNAWSHIVFQRRGNTLEIYLNGTLQTVTSGSSSFTGTIFNSSRIIEIGAQNAAALPTGYISNLRVLKGTAQYTANFTPPTAPLTAITNTSLLLNFTNGGIFDNASQTVLETVGNAQVSTTQKKYGTGSMYFDGTGDWLIAPDRPPLRFGTGAFTVEGWIYFDGTGSRGIVSKGGTLTGWVLRLTSNPFIAFTFGNGSVDTSIFSSVSLTANTWYHVAVVREGTGTNQTKLYVNGVNDGTGTCSINFNQTNSLYIGSNRGTSNPYTGYIDDLRITNGYARYTANFTPPTAAFPDN